MNTETRPNIGHHTPGPWIVRPPQAHGTQVRGIHGVAVAWCGCATVSGLDGAYSITPEEAEANAHLIVAAPALLDALDNLVRACELPGDHCKVARALPAAIAAISKALGVTPDASLTGPKRPEQEHANGKK